VKGVSPTEGKRGRVENGNSVIGNASKKAKTERGRWKK